MSQEDYEEQNGSHIWEDHFYPEVVDKDTGEPLPEGQDGVLIFTTLTKQGVPLLRYWTNDITHLFYDSDAKRTHIKMGPIKGRSDDMLIIRGVNLFHTQVEEVLKEFEELSINYQLIVSRSNNLDEVEVKVKFNEDVYDKIEFDKDSDLVKRSEGQLQKKLKDQIGLNMTISLVGNGDVPRSVGGKLSRIEDQRK